MVSVTLAKNAGFCFGVKRAIDMVNENLKKFGTLYCVGELIHNEKVIDELEKKGLVIVDKEEALKLKNENVVIRSHGIEKKIFEEIERNGNNIIDCTCPFVKKIHKLVEEHSKNDEKIVVIGDKEHQEVKGIVSYGSPKSEKNIDNISKNIAVVNSVDELKGLQFDKNDKIFIVSQTTANIEKNKKIVDIFKDLFYNIQYVDTICNATEHRQNEVFEMSKCCDVMIIVGSKNSSNTKKLYDIAKNNCENTFYVNDVSELQNVNISTKNKIGISAGASTPSTLIEEILKYARTKF